MRATTSSTKYLVFALLSGCLFQSMSPATKLREAVQDGNEAARWTRMDIAMEKVAPAYAGEYARRHHDWGRGIQMADLDIVRMQMAEDEKSATVTIAFGWYAYDTMSLKRTVVRQRWQSGAGGFLLTEEEVVDGDPRLLEPPPAPEGDDEVATEDADDEELASDRDEADGADGDATDNEEWIEDEGEAVDETSTLARAPTT